MRPRYLSLALLLVAIVPDAARSHPPTIEQWFPADTVIWLKLEQPAVLVRQITQYLRLPGLRGLTAYREYFDSTNYRKFSQFLTFAEERLGQRWPVLLDRLAGGGVALGILEIKDGEESPVLAVIQGRDPASTQQAVQLLFELARQEADRDEGSAAAWEQKTVGKFSTYRFEQLHVAVVEGSVLFANQEAVLRAALQREGQANTLATRAELAEARRMVGAEVHAWGYVNVGPFKANPSIQQALYTLPADEPLPHVFLGGWFDAVRRAPWLVAAVNLRDDGPHLTVQVPAGRAGANPAIARAFHAASAPGTIRPLLEPPGTLYTAAFHWDWSAFWELRQELMTAGVVKEFEEFDRNSANLLFGKRFGQLLQLAGARQRFVVARQDDSGYSIRPKSPQPSYGLVTDVRQPAEFSRAIQLPLRSLGLLGSFGLQMKMVEETRGNTKLVGYRFLENESNRERDHGFVFNFSPCFAQIGNQFIVASTLDLGRKLVDAVAAEPTTASLPARVPASATASDVTPTATPDSFHRFSWSGLGLLIEAERATTLTDLYLRLGGDLAAAQRELDAVLATLKQLGSVEAATYYEPERLRLEVRAKLGSPR